MVGRGVGGDQGNLVFAAVASNFCFGLKIDTKSRSVPSDLRTERSCSCAKTEVARCTRDDKVHAQRPQALLPFAAD